MTDILQNEKKDIKQRGLPIEFIYFGLMIEGILLLMFLHLDTIILAGILIILMFEMWMSDANFKLSKVVLDLKYAKELELTGIVMMLIILITAITLSITLFK